MQGTHLRIEQVELIRRLRNSGVSLQQITEAYQVFERLDNEFGSFGTVKVSQPCHQAPTTPTTNPVHSPHDVQCNFMAQTTSDCSSDHTDRKRNAPPVNQNSSAHMPMQQNSLFPSQSKIARSKEGPPGWSPEVANNASSPLLRKGDGRHVGLNDNNSDSFQLYNSTPDNIRPANNDHCNSSSCQDDVATWNLPTSESQCPPPSSALMAKRGSSSTFNNKNGSSTNSFKTLPTMISSESALREAGRCMLLSATSDEIVTLIRKCSMSIETFDPCQLCTIYGLTHSELSNVLSGHIPHEGDHGLQIVDWFVNIMIKTDWFISDVMKYSQQITAPKQAEPVDIDFTPRRERFTFRDVHLEVMESHFKIDHYPSQKEKEMIANECNIKMAMASNSELTEKERVTHINVDHWFRNKRKEMIRRAKMDKLDAYRMALPGPVKSSRKLNDSTSSEDPDKEVYFSTLTAARPIHTFTTRQASRLAKGKFQTSSTPTKETCLHNQSQSMNPSVSNDNMEVPATLPAAVPLPPTDEDSQAASSKEPNVDVKVEQVNEEEA